MTWLRKAINEGWTGSALQTAGRARYYREVTVIKTDTNLVSCNWDLRTA
jgi:hypothetical protein